MKRSVLTALAFLLVGCAHTYNMPEAERSRSYRADTDLVWEAALASVDDIGLALVQTEEEHGSIRARAGGGLFDQKGHVLLVVIREIADGRVRVDANAESVSEENIIDFGKSGKIVRGFLEAMDNRVVGEG